jgi:predicted TIM-barrel fold metal-dependent hydrolase
MLNATIGASSPLRIVDFHNHFVGPKFVLATPADVPPPMRDFWDGVHRSLANQDELISSMESNGIAVRVISAPLEFLENGHGDVSPDTISRMNDAIASVVNLHRDRLYGLGTVDAYSGEAGARELTRCVKELGLRGAFVESAKGDLLPDAPEARPTFAAAAALGVPVFMHPVADPQMNARFKRLGPLGLRLTRSTINSAALFAVLQSGMFEELPNLRVVVTALAIGGVMIAGTFKDGSLLSKDTPATNRRHVYIDTTGLHPIPLRTAVDLVGADHVLMGTDWPVVAETVERMQTVLSAAGLDAVQQQMIAGQNTLQLLGAA